MGAVDSLSVHSLDQIFWKKTRVWISKVQGLLHLAVDLGDDLIEYWEGNELGHLV